MTINPGEIGKRVAVREAMINNEARIQILCEKEKGLFFWKIIPFLTKGTRSYHLPENTTYFDNWLDLHHRHPPPALIKNRDGATLCLYAHTIGESPKSEKSGRLA